MRPSDQFLALADQCIPSGPAHKLRLIEEAENRAAKALHILEREIPQGMSITAEAWQDLRESLAATLLWMLRFGLGALWLDRASGCWIESQRELFTRLAEDSDAIHRTFGRPARRLVGIHGELSHRHHGGRSVASLEFASGLRLIYKPRGMALEGWFSSLLDEFDEEQAPIRFRAARVLDRGHYGWAKRMAHRACHGEEELRHFYRRSGGLLCLLHLLQATDVHYENLIACGPDPVLVDAETLLQPSLDAGPASVLRTGMIPVPRVDGSDFSALGFVRERHLPFPVDSHCATPVLHLRPSCSVPVEDSAGIAPELFAQEQVDGFRLTWNWVSRHRSLLLDYLEQARDLEIRYVVRDTQDYYLALAHALFTGNPGAVVLPELDGERTAFSFLLQEEHRALAQLDLPRFTLSADARAIALNGASGNEVFPRSGYAAAKEAVTTMHEDELERQLARMDGAWQFYAVARRLLCPLQG
ncbi:type 2 lanthipeptide synthetase LanM [Silvibacterium dinghuense]|uniref:DUF4135 domain-containing protein n=1 Tax=Silvibacterium dinghuense TaxID=1560006 RepID=A0A4Q1SHA1_9BACT|nr:type 2 lanthipeptide synthetase LanM [Silvibacterium dinghuense]RXS96735.1 DUF4135 domain-containing protein [Silvibacterium dinghuense]GGG93230.1 hypothetical protein GCM10011586_04950 [Silvibacterium dinghuense]